MLQLKMFLSFTNNRLLFALIFACFTNWVFSQATLTNDAKISVLTCGPGTDLYNTFGHTAIRIYDPQQDINVVFNYGMFSFGGSSTKDQIDFGIRFVRGKLDYWLGVQEFDNFINEYVYQKRWVFEQELNLSQTKKQELFEALLINYQPENRKYQYDFFFDNCSSRVRDMIEQVNEDAFGGKDGAVHEGSGKSYIDLIDPYIQRSPWLDFGMDIMLGTKSSREASLYETMFLPDHLMEQVSAANGLVKNEHYLYQPEEQLIVERFHLFTPLFVFSILLVIVAFISYFNFKKERYFYWIDGILLSLTGLMGCLFLFMWVGTDHQPAHINMNMFWAFPLNIIAVFLIRKFAKGFYFKMAAGFAAFILLAWFLSPQQYHVAIIPIAIMLLIRYARIIDWGGKIEN